MYCPYCATRLTVVGREAWCENGSSFSVVMTAALVELVSSPPTPVKPYPPQWGCDYFHCPADGERFVEYERRPRCPECARELSNQMAYRLLQFNPHVPGQGPPG